MLAVCGYSYSCTFCGRVWIVLKLFIMGLSYGRIIAVICGAIVVKCIAILCGAVCW